MAKTRNTVIVGSALKSQKQGTCLPGNHLKGLNIRSVLHLILRKFPMFFIFTGSFGKRRPLNPQTVVAVRPASGSSSR